jgi:hypothetical protein
MSSLGLYFSRLFKATNGILLQASSVFVAGQHWAHSYPMCPRMPAVVQDLSSTWYNISGAGNKHHLGALVELAYGQV